MTPNQNKPEKDNAAPSPVNFNGSTGHSLGEEGAKPELPPRCYISKNF